MIKLCYHCMTQIKEEKLNKCPNCGKSLTPEPVSDRYLKPGTELQNKFIVGYPIGAGGFGNTYIGWNKLLLRRVAIKEFYPEQYITRAKDRVTVSVATETLQPRFRKGLQQFIEEARSVAALQDIKGVVEISNFFEENGTGYIIMEYLEGMDVKTILKKSGNKKDYEWCRRVILTLLHTLREIHKRGVLHRDIAPDNIFVTREGIIKLIDFGAARHSTALANMKSEVILKVGYAPIEQYSREAPQGPYTDLYAVAALFYRMLTGQKPIPADERMNEDTLIVPSEMGVELPEQAEMAIMVCLNIQPQYRLQSADEFMEALDGKNFVPVYEPEWILPPVEEKSSFSNMPIAARIGIVLASIFVVLGVVFGGAAIINNTLSGEKHETLSGSDAILADLTGETVEEAEQELNRMGFGGYSVIYEYEFSQEPEGTIIRQNPKAGAIPEGQETVVTLYISGGQQQYTLEDFREKSIDEIRDYFAKYNFTIYENAYPGAEMVLANNTAGGDYSPKTGTIHLIYEYTDDYPAGICYSQSLDAGTMCDGSEDVTFAISCGKVSDYEIVIPDFTGMGKKKVEKVLEETGLSAYLQLEFEDGSSNNEIEKGKVEDQSILPGAIYNVLEGKTYEYAEETRINEQSNNLLTLWLSTGRPSVRSNRRNLSSGTAKKSDAFEVDIDE